MILLALMPKSISGTLKLKDILVIGGQIDVVTACTKTLLATLTSDDAGNPKKWRVYTLSRRLVAERLLVFLPDQLLCSGETATIYALNDRRSYIIEKVLRCMSLPTKTFDGAFAKGVGVMISRRLLASFLTQSIQFSWIVGLLCLSYLKLLILMVQLLFIICLKVKQSPWLNGTILRKSFGIQQIFIAEIM